MKIAALLYLIGAACLPSSSFARSWRHIIPYREFHLTDPAIAIESQERDPLLFTSSPSSSPSHSPSAAPSTSEPSSIPSEAPTITPVPTLMPSSSPSSVPTVVPSSTPSFTPSAAPTSNAFPLNPVPSNPPNRYFNYDPSSPYGPGLPKKVMHNATTEKIVYQDNGWEDVAYPNGSYWHEFGAAGSGPWNGTLAKYEPGKNRCRNVGWQSPIDVVPNGAVCDEHHQIRSRPGDMDISNDTATTKLIESNKLRLVYSRRPCRDYLLPECAEPDSPNSDFPNGWGGYSDAMHVDFKTPSEHTVFGKRYHGEMHIFHLHPGRRRTPTAAVLIEATNTAYNFEFQAILDEFQGVYDKHQALCGRKTRRERKLISKLHRLLGGTVKSEIDYETWGDFSTTLDDPKKRDLRGSRFWHPHHEELVPSLYFYRYDGSLTEPPCGEWVSWFVIDTPMKVHFRQLEQLQRLVFTHVSPSCEKTSVHFDNSVARPIQDKAGRPVWRCTSANFPPDADRPNIFQQPVI